MKSNKLYPYSQIQWVETSESPLDKQGEEEYARNSDTALRQEQMRTFVSSLTYFFKEK